MKGHKAPTSFINQVKMYKVFGLVLLSKVESYVLPAAVYTCRCLKGTVLWPWPPNSSKHLHPFKRQRPCLSLFKSKLPQGGILSECSIAATFWHLHFEDLVCP